MSVTARDYRYKDHAIVVLTRLSVKRSWFAIVLSHGSQTDDSSSSDD